MPENGQRSPSTLTVVRIVPVPASTSLVAAFAGPVEGMLTHYQNKASHACPGEGKCPPAFHKGRTIWKGYAPVRLWDPRARSWAPAVLEVTECLEELLRGRDLVGEVWALSREPGKGKMGTVVGSYLETKTDAGLCASFDIRPTLARRYHPVAFELGIPNPIPPKKLLPIVQAAPPTLPAFDQHPEPPPVTEAQRETLRRLAIRANARVEKSNGKG